MSAVPATKGVQVVVRFRPLNETEKAQGPDPCVAVPSSTEIAVVGEFSPLTKGGGALDVALDQQKNFTFDYVFNPMATQVDLYDAVGKPVVTNVLKGYNGTILAYGQTGSGKTHSMLGPEGGTMDVLSTTSPHHTKRGVIPRLIEDLFERLVAFPEQEISWKVTACVFELYKEQIQDLLTEGPQQEYKIREDIVGGRGIYVDNLYAKQCLSATELLEAVRVGVSRRKVASTKSNDTSSRSHSLTMIALEQTNHVQGGTVTRSRLNLIDLAGSEKVGKTQADGERLKEAQQINLSLTFLGNVINKLTDGKGGFIPYRDSKLTRILQDSLGGNSVTTLLCHCSMATYNREETLGTLRFAARAKRIKNAPKVNRDLSQKELQLQLAQALDRINFLEAKLALQSNLATEPSVRRERSHGLQASHEDPHSSGGLAASEHANDSMIRLREEHEEMRGTVDSLLQQLEEVKRDLFSREEQLSERVEQVEFYKQRANAAETELQEQASRWKREEALLLRRLSDVQAENVQLTEQLQTQKAVLLEQLPSTVSFNDHGLATSTQRTHKAPTASARVTNLRRTAADAQRTVTELQSSTKSGTMGGIEVIGSGRGPRAQPTANSANTEARPALHPAGIPPSELVDSAVQRQGSASGTSKHHRAAPQTATVDVVTPQTVEVLDSVEVGKIPTPPTTPLGGGLAPRQSITSSIATHVAVETADVGIMALVGKSEAELQKEIDDMQVHMKMLMQKSAVMSKSITESQDQIAKLTDLVEVAHNERDDVSQELDALRKLLESKEKENEFMKRILDELNINLADFQHLLSTEKTRAQQLLDEAEGLRTHNSALQQTADQQEFVEMATMELLIKAEDMEAVEQDLMRMPTLPTEELFLKKRDFCLQILAQLNNFLDHVSGQLSRQRFNTGNLESRRLQLLAEAAGLTSRCDDAKALLKG